MTASSVLVWIGHGALGLLVLACGAISWSTSRRPTTGTQRWARFWASAPWLATAACGLVGAQAALSILELWATGFERSWSSVGLVALSLGERLSIEWMSLSAALGLWCPVVLWPMALGLPRSGRAKLAIGVVCFWAGLGCAAWSCREFLALLPETMAPTFLPFDVLEASRSKFALGVLAAATGLAVGGGLVAWAAWHATSGASPRRRWVSSASVGLLGASAILVCAPLGSRMAWENAHPIDTRFAFVNCGLCFPPPLALGGSGPHDLADAPNVVLDPSRFTVDGSPAGSHADLRNILRSKRMLWGQLNPNQDFPGTVVLNVRGLRTVGELEAAFRTALGAGYPTVLLAYTEVLRETRPILGAVAGRRDTALRSFLAAWRGECPAGTNRVVHLPSDSERSLVGWVNELDAGANTNLCVILPTFDCPRTLSGCRGIEAAGFDVVHQWSLGKRVEAVQLRRHQEEYQVAVVGFEAADTRIGVELMNDPRDPWNGFHALEARARRGGRRLVWAMNAGMYQPDRSPVGLLVSDSEERAPLVTRRGAGNFFLMPNGVFAVTRLGIDVETTSAWQHGLHGEPEQATQSGPMLVIGGQLHPAFEKDSASRLIRNGVGVAPAGVVMAISTTRVNFHEFASLMRDLGCSNALYLDGNVSSVFAPELERRDTGLGLGPVIVVSEAEK
ncbi:MAG TPA: phosphodiester glycosidase family protein [Polyangiaceae bacterium]|nr:phosphodiester glycosidase family protein [Polyangiaceae bacterium]